MGPDVAAKFDEAMEGAMSAAGNAVASVAESGQDEALKSLKEMVEKSAAELANYLPTGWENQETKVGLKK
eukprot:scaffold281497_cov48-Prasinocladus_malaysianus.AAC.1